MGSLEVGGSLTVAKCADSEIQFPVETDCLAGDPQELRQISERVPGSIKVFALFGRVDPITEDLPVTEAKLFFELIGRYITVTNLFTFA